MSYFKNRDVFTLAHGDRRFYAWKREQLNHCQNGRCAWCGYPVKMNESEIDHVLPLIFFGKNEPWNMVVACKECNGNKSSDTKGWNETGNRLIGNKKPKWVQKNKCDFLMRKALVDAEKKYNEGESSGSMVLAKQQAVAS